MKKLETTLWYKLFYKNPSNHKDLYELSLKQIASSEEEKFYKRIERKDNTLDLH